MKNRIRHNKTPYRGTPKTNRFITLLNPGLFLEGFFVIQSHRTWRLLEAWLRWSKKPKLEGKLRLLLAYLSLQGPKSYDFTFDLLFSSLVNLDRTGDGPAHRPGRMTPILSQKVWVQNPRKVKMRHVLTPGICISKWILIPNSFTAIIHSTGWLFTIVQILRMEW